MTEDVMAGCHHQLNGHEFERTLGVSDGQGGLAAIPLRGLEGVPGLAGAPQDEAGLTRKFETSHVGGATC